MKQFLPNGTCVDCLGCCRFLVSDSVWSPSLLDQDIRKLLKNKIPPSLISTNKKLRLIPGQKKENFICAFLNTQDNKCKIYSFRPFECQLYPFLINKQAKKLFLAIDLNCHFIKENLENIELRNYAQYLIELLNTPSKSKIFKDNPQIIQEYSGVLNLAELKI